MASLRGVLRRTARSSSRAVRVFFSSKRQPDKSSSTATKPGFDPSKPIISSDWLPGDWSCPECGAHNIGGRKSCRVCRHKITFEAIERSRMNTETWECVACVWKNDASRMVCYSCRAPKNNPLQTLNKYGSWYCSRCKVYNGDREPNCHVCKRSMAECANTSPDGVRRPPNKREIKPGDWICENCKTHNFDSESKCKSCGKGVHAKEKMRREILFGDWVCTACNEVNFAKQKQCFVCHTPRDDLKYCPELTAGVQTPGAWECPVCNLVNSSPDKPVCKSCGYRLPAAQEAQVGDRRARGYGAARKKKKKELPLVRRRLPIFPPTFELFKTKEEDDQDAAAAAGGGGGAGVGGGGTATAAAGDGGYELYGEHDQLEEQLQQSASPSFQLLGPENPIADEEWHCYNCGARNVGLNPCHSCAPEDSSGSIKQPGGRSSANERR